MTLGLAMRRRRIVVKGEGAHYHCISRACGGERLFGDGEKEYLRELIWRVAAFSGVEVLTYCVMSNHFHVLVFVPASQEVGDDELLRRFRRLYGNAGGSSQVPTPEVLEAHLSRGGKTAEDWRRRMLERMHDVSEFMKTLKQRFSVWYNRRKGRFGTLWAERFKSVLVESTKHALSTVAAYIDLNPLRAGIVRDPAGYRWCGYAEAMAGLKRAREAMARVGRAKDTARALERYRSLLFGCGSRSRGNQGEWTREQVRRALPRDGEITGAEALRCRIRYFSDGWVIGSRSFVEGWVERSRRAAATSPVATLNVKEWSGLVIFGGLRGGIFS